MFTKNLSATSKQLANGFMLQLLDKTDQLKLRANFNLVLLRTQELFVFREYLLEEDYKVRV
jgi:hypothetical protein